MGLLAVVLLILTNAFFVAGEFALVAVDRNRIEQLAEQGGRRARRVLRALRTLSFQLSGAQLGITVSSLVIGFIAEPTIAEALRPLLSGFVPTDSVRGASVAVALTLATVVQMVVGELVPKNLAIARPLAAAMAIAAPMQGVNSALRPLITFLNGAANWTVERLGIEPREELAGVRSLEELELVIRSSGQRGAIDETELSLLTRSINFGEKRAADALVPRLAVVALPQQGTLADLARVAAASGHSRFPVYGEDLDDLAGVVHVKDCYRVPPERRASTSLASVAKEPLIVPATRGLSAILNDMQTTRRQLAVVVNEYGETAGIITIEDLLEEIIGEIQDEYDQDLAGERPAVPPTTQSVSGLLRWYEVAELTGLEMPEGNFETLGGFLLALFERIPEAGERTAWEGWEFEILELDRRRIARVRITAPAEAGE